MQLKQVQVGYWAGRTPARIVLSDVQTDLAPGEFACVIGPNGCGKSTMMRSLARFQPLLGGTVTVDGHDLAGIGRGALARTLAVVLTDRVGVGQLRVRDLVALGRYPHSGLSGRLRAADHERVAWSLAATGAGPLADRLLPELSDGERQRVMVARALAQEPRVILLDEPTAFLDVSGRVELLTLLLRLTREVGLAVLLSSHDLDLVLRYADRVWLVSEGRVQVGAPEDLALSGRIQQVFGGPDVEFDQLIGTFRPRLSTVGSARVVGTGIGAVWARRALERLGYAVVGGDELKEVAVAVHLTENDGSPAWRLVHHDDESHHHSLLALTDRLRPTASDIVTTENDIRLV